MAWEWSHTAEAYEAAQANMEALDRETREVIASEWLATPNGFSIDMDMKRYWKATCRVKTWTDEKLNEFIWANMENLATCTNGGYEAYCCPHGCGPHLVAFSRKGEAHEQR